MAADRRNTSVVIALIVSMTLGAVMLIYLEPKRPGFPGSTLLTAERGERIQEVVVNYVPSKAALDEIAFDPEGDDSPCVIAADGELEPWVPRGPRVQLIVIGGEGDQLGDAQKDKLRLILGQLSRYSGQALVPVRLAAGSDDRQIATLPSQVRDLREFLQRKGLLQ